MKLFINQIEDGINEEYLKYDSGKVCCDEHEYVIGWEEYGAREMFSIGQPVYDEEGDLMGYLGISLYSNLNYFNDGECRIPAERWSICLPTKYCEAGKRVITYWQKQHNIKVTE